MDSGLGAPAVCGSAAVRPRARVPPSRSPRTGGASVAWAGVAVTSSSARSVNSSPRITQVASIRRANWFTCRWKLQNSFNRAGLPLVSRWVEAISSGPGVHDSSCAASSAVSVRMRSRQPHRTGRAAQLHAQSGERRSRWSGTCGGDQQQCSLPSAGAARATPADFPRPPKCMSSKTRTCGPRAHSPTTYRRAWSNAFSAVIEASGMRPTQSPIRVNGAASVSSSARAHSTRTCPSTSDSAEVSTADLPDPGAPSSQVRRPCRRGAVRLGPVPPRSRPACRPVGGRPRWWGGQPGQILLEAVRVHGHDPAVAVLSAGPDRCPTAPR